MVRFSIVPGVMAVYINGSKALWLSATIGDKRHYGVGIRNFAVCSGGRCQRCVASAETESYHDTNFILTQAVFMTTSGTTNDDKVNLMATHDFQCYLLNKGVCFPLMIWIGSGFNK